MNSQRNISLLKVVCFLYAGLLLGLGTETYAHSTNQSIMQLSQDQGELTGQWWIPLRFLDRVLDLDKDQNQQITWREILGSQTRIESYLNQDVRFTQQRSEGSGNDRTCNIQTASFMLQERREGLALLLPFSVNCPELISPANPVQLDYQLFFNEDHWHRGYIRFQQDSFLQNYIASPAASRFQLGPSASPLMTQLNQFLIEGVWHIWIGLDHILFLMALLLPVVFNYQRTVAGKIGQQTRHEQFRPMFFDTLKIVTAFTLSHSITLGLAAFELVTLPSRMIEIAIAVSVVISALLLWLPAWQRYRWPIALVFGLVHGFGFANVLGDLTLPTDTFAWCLLAFNIGVELGQLAIVSVVLPLMFILRNTRLYTQVAIPYAMSSIALVGVFWTIERSIA